MPPYAQEDQPDANRDRNRQSQAHILFRHWVLLVRQIPEVTLSLVSYGRAGVAVDWYNIPVTLKTPV